MPESSLTAGPGMPLRPSGPGFPGDPCAPTGPVFPAGPSVPRSPYYTGNITNIYKYFSRFRN